MITYDYLSYTYDYLWLEMNNLDKLLMLQVFRNYTDSFSNIYP